MFAEVPFFPEQASTMASRVDALFFFLCGVTGTMAILIAGLLCYFAFRYRRRRPDERTPRIEGNPRLEWFWTIAPLFVFLAMFVWGASVYTSLTSPPPDAPEVYVVGKQWMWKIQHPDGESEIDKLTIPVDRPVKLILQTWFHPTKTGEFHLFCAEYCGTSHSNMIGKVVVLDRDKYREWSDEKAQGSLALKGRQLFLKLQCVTCHSANAEARAPVLEDLYKKTVPLRNGRTVLADESYLEESILYPEAKVVQGWEPIMPTFKGQVNKDEMIQLLAFLKSLKPGQTPVRNEEFPPPLDAPKVPPGGNPKGKEAVPTSAPQGKNRQP
jgi:cytochrome c oxidase subunit 2